MKLLPRIIVIACPLFVIHAAISTSAQEGPATAAGIGGSISYTKPTAEEAKDRIDALEAQVRQLAKVVEALTREVGIERTRGGEQFATFESVIHEQRAAKIYGNGSSSVNGVASYEYYIKYDDTGEQKWVPQGELQSASGGTQNTTTNTTNNTTNTNSTTTNTTSTTVTQSASAQQLAQDVLAEHNLARSNPPAYVAILKSYADPKLAEMKKYVQDHPNDQSYRDYVTDWESCYASALSDLSADGTYSVHTEALKLNDKLTQAAQKHADWLSNTPRPQRPWNVHYGPTQNDSPGSRMKNEGYNFWYWGENITSGNTARAIVAGLIIDNGNSPNYGHRKTILRSAYPYAEIGFGQNSGGGVVVTYAKPGS